MRVPESWKDKQGKVSAFYERLDSASEQEVAIDGFQLRILYEQPRDGFSYGCTPADVIRILRRVVHLSPVLPDIIAFRQPTRKQQKQKTVWGRFLFHAELGKHKGTAIILEAQELGSILKWPKRMTVEDREEYDRLVSDGHEFVEKKRHFQAELTEVAVRNTKLYRTLLHEIGHLVHYHQSVHNQQTALDESLEIARDLHFAIPNSEREIFAHSFSDKLSRAIRIDSEIYD